MNQGSPKRPLQKPEPSALSKSIAGGLATTKPPLLKCTFIIAFTRYSLCCISASTRHVPVGFVSQKFEAEGSSPEKTEDFLAGSKEWADLLAQSTPPSSRFSIPQLQVLASLLYKQRWASIFSAAHRKNAFSLMIKQAFSEDQASLYSRPRTLLSVSFHHLIKTVAAMQV